ncbi:unnamed protein product, partial [Cylicostephanus goldi]
AVDTTVRGTKSITAKFKIFANSIAAVDKLDNRAKINGEEIKSITINGKALDLKKNPAANRFSFSVEDGIVTFKNAAEGTTVVVATAKCAGITFTYEFTLNLTKGATPKFKALTTYVEEKDGKYAHTNNFEFPGTLAVDNAKATFADGNFNWKDYDSLVVNTVAYLVVAGVEKDTIDQVNIKFWTKDPIKSVAHKDSTVKHNPTAGDRVDLKSLFTVKDYMDSTVIKNGADHFVGSYDYGINFEFGADSTWTVKGGTLPKGALTLAGSKLTLSAQGAQIVNPVTVEIPFVVKHALDKFGVAAEDRQGTVKVTFTSEK